LGYSEDHADYLVEILTDLTHDDPEVRAKVLKEFASIAGVARKPRTKKVK
jgi:hypothetical protein